MSVTLSRRAGLLGALTAAAVLVMASPAAALPPFGTAAVSATGAGGQTVLTSVTVGHHQGFDRVVFTSRQGLGGYSVRYVAAITADPSGKPVPLLGSAALLVTFQGTPWTTSPAPQPTITAGFPALKQVKGAGEFEAVASYGLGQATRAGFRAFTLTGPSRLVVDVAASAGGAVGTPSTGAGTGTGTSTGTGGGLPNTGFDTVPLAWVGLALVLAGALTVGVARRYRAT